MTDLARWILLTILAILSTVGYGYAEHKIIRPGDQFPELYLFTPEDDADRAYLQINQGKTFTPSQVKTALLVVELLNVHCLHCQMQAPAYNELVKLIEANPQTRGKIKLLGVAVGNLDWEVESFRQKHAVAFPIIPDANFAAWRATGGSATPLTFYVRQDRPGQPGTVIGIHRGLNTHYQKLYETLAEMVDKDPSTLLHQTPDAVAREESVAPIISNEEVELRVKTALTRFGQIETFSKVSLRSGRQVYTALVGKGENQERLFAEVASRDSICDICHDLHFIYLFDTKTRIIAFEPLHVTKYGNVSWTQEEEEIMRGKVIGRYLDMPQPFDPKLDAISSATITSAMIFDSLSQGEELIKELRAQGLM